MKNALTFSCQIRALRDSIRDSLWAAKDNVLYCSVKKNAFVARFSRASYYQIAEFIECSDGEDEYFISLNGRHFCITIAA